MFVVATRALVGAKSGEEYYRKEVVEDAFDWFPNDRGYKFGRRGKHIVRIADNPKKYPASRECKGMIMDLVTTIGEDGRMPTLQRMAKLIGVSDRQMQRHLTAMRKWGIVKRSEGSYYLNPAYLFTGVYLSPSLYALFQSDVDPLISRKAQEKYAVLLTERVRDEQVQTTDTGPDGGEDEGGDDRSMDEQDDGDT